MSQQPAAQAMDFIPCQASALAEATVGTNTDGSTSLIAGELWRALAQPRR